MSHSLYERIIKGRRQLLEQNCRPTKIRLTQDQYRRLCEELDYPMLHSTEHLVYGGPPKIDGMIIEIKESP